MKFNNFKSYLGIVSKFNSKQQKLKNTFIVFKAKHSSKRSDVFQTFCYVGLFLLYCF